MNTVDPVLSNFATALSAVVASGDAERLREYLEGDLPAFGGDLDPADVLLRAIPLAGDASTLPQHLAGLLAVVLNRITEDFKAARGQTSSSQRYALLSALYLAADLPADPDLFGALKLLLAQVQPKSDSELGIPLWRALVYQQTDASLNQAWLTILELSGSEALTPARRTLLLIAWRGLLWIPPSAEMRQAGLVVDFDRIARGLEALYRGLSVLYGPDLENQEARLFLKTCLDILGETYPRSAEFWADRFLPYVLRWPQEFAALVTLKWPHPRVPEAQRVQEAREEATKILERTVADLSAGEAQVERNAEDLIKAINEEIKKQQSWFPASDAALLAKLHALNSLYREVKNFDRGRQRQIESLIRTLRKAV
jgi:hypothetical protein